MLKNGLTYWIMMKEEEKWSLPVGKKQKSNDFDERWEKVKYLLYG